MPTKCMAEQDMLAKFYLTRAQLWLHFAQINLLLLLKMTILARYEISCPGQYLLLF